MKKIIFILLILMVSVGAFAEGQMEGDANDTARVEMRQTESNHARLVARQPAPTLDFSLERANLIKRMELMNDQNRIGYVYILSFGNPIGFFVIKGKVSSVNSLLTNPNQIVDDPHGGYDSGGRIVSSPDFDGSYGANPDGIFFFTTEGEMVETSEDYIYMTRPLKPDIPEL